MITGDHKFRLLLPPLLACVADVAMTLIGQPAAYWSGNRKAVLEFNPVARLLLEFHPLTFPIVAAGCFLVLAVVLTRWQNRRLAFVLAFCVTLAQGAAAAGWMLRFGPIGWAGAIALLLASERLFAWAAPASAERLACDSKALGDQVSPARP